MSGDYVITRGGSYAASRQVLRSAARGHGARTNASNLGEGFRIAAEIGNCAVQTCNNGDAGFYCWPGCSTAGGALGTFEGGEVRSPAHAVRVVGGCIRRQTASLIDRAG